MTILPLVERELRIRARSPAGYWTRFLAALAGILVCLPALALFGGARSNQAENGAFAFNGLVVAAFVFCCFSGFLTVDGISRERREGTLGLLFLMRVRALDVLLGNFGAAGIASLCALAAFVPVLIVPVLTGGVSGGEAARKVLALFDTMILSLAAGLWASAGGRGWSSCARSAAGVLFLVIFSPLVLGAFLPLFSQLFHTWPGPLSALEAAKDVNYRKSAAPYWVSIVTIHEISWLLVIGAGIRLRRAMREEDETPVQSASPARIPKPPAAGEAPLEWLMRRQRGIKTVAWAGALLKVAYYSGFMFVVRFSRGSMGAYGSWGMGFACSAVQDCLFAWAASRFFIEARRTGELELLLTTPEGASTLVSSQWKWLKDVFRWPLVVLVAIQVMMSLFGLLRGSGWEFAIYSLSWLLFACLDTIAGLVALLWAGMWFGWAERSQARAILRIVIVAGGVPYVIGLVGSIVLVRVVPMAFFVSNGSFRPWLNLVRNFPSMVNLLFYLWLIRWAARRLTTEFGCAAGENRLKLFHRLLLRSVFPYHSVSDS
jgi:ABC-type transport system involved in multi-copper enzyme maturation permease subunit